jgi:hypothetical protein
MSSGNFLVVSLLTRSQQYILRRGMPQDEADSPLVIQQVYHWLRQSARYPAIRDLPHFDHTVFRAGRYHVVVMRGPGDV